MGQLSSGQLSMLQISSPPTRFTYRRHRITIEELDSAGINPALELAPSCCRLETHYVSYGYSDHETPLDRIEKKNGCASCSNSIVSSSS